jgi:lipoate-protein ligase A
MRIQALRASGHDPVANLAVEEALLERGAGSEFLAYVNDPCVVVGRNQNPWAEVSPRCALPVLRRVSGGGTVYHDHGNLNWSFILPRSVHDQCAELEAIASALRRLGLRAETGPRGGLFALVDGGMRLKISGTARRLTAGRVIHHGTLLVDADLAALAASLGGMETLDSRALPSVPSMAANLSTLVPGLGVDDLVSLLCESLGAGCPASATEAADPSIARAAAVRLASWEWTWGSTPAFSVAVPGPREAVMEVRTGFVSEVRGRDSPALASLVGTRFGYGIPDKARDLLEII